MFPPKISIVTISFNQGEYLDECIRSVIDQGYQNLQYVIVDPGSKDDSREIISRYAGRGVVAVLEPDQGPADGLNKGFAHCDGAIFGYINADDRLCPNSLAYAGNFFEKNPDVDVLTGSIRMIDKAGLPNLRGRTSDRFSLADYAAGICTIGQQATFFRRDAFIRAGGFNPGNRIAWDGELLVDMALAGCRFTRTHKTLGDFRYYAESLSGNEANRDKQNREIERLGLKISSAGHSVYSPLSTRIRRIAYKLNIRRHLSYLMVR